MAPVSDPISNTEINAALQSVLTNPRFDGAGRVKDILSYTVAEEVAGRGEQIRGKTIVADVYGRETLKGSDPVNAIRVQARRLRRLLDQYYETAGRNDPVRIHIDRGSYRPRFERVFREQAPKAAVRKQSKWTTIGAFSIGTLTGAALTALLFVAVKPWAFKTTDGDDQSTVIARAERASLYDKSPVTLQAFNLADQAREMLFPLFDRPRQLLALSVFQRVIELDPSYYGGYAGAAQALATLSILEPSSDKRSETVTAALEMAESAVQIAPTEAWSQSAMSFAMFASGEYDESLALGQRTVQLDPDDGHVLDYFGTVALFSGRFEEAANSSGRDDLTSSSNQRFARRNISGAANYHLGNYATTVENFESAAEFGDPLSAPSLAYHAAALARLGQTDAATEKLKELDFAWPNAPIKSMLVGIFSKGEFVGDVTAELEKLGWSNPVKRPSDQE
ncbi:tetratricopeptide repeat protein [Ruegeria arenilitoris]|uniref:tetratricopeptide repeat protein n=1 Tax=Ruegeria arenilitoris TaxID=1173585 RepID=UPI00147B6B5F|nr:tetratricopeptide repeat protein [Ruegeria arenilitoris]